MLKVLSSKQKKNKNKKNPTEVICTLFTGQNSKEGIFLVSKVLVKEDYSFGKTNLLFFLACLKRVILLPMN